MKHAGRVMLTLLALTGTAWAQDLPDKRPLSFSSLAGSADRMPRAVNVLAIDSDPQVGRPAPDFELDGPQGQPVKRADLRGRWAVMVFDEVRRGFAGLEGIHEPLDRMGVRLYGVCPDGWPALRDFARRENLSFALLSDPTRQISQVFDMFDRSSGGIRPGIVILDPAGVVRRVVDDHRLGGPELLDLVQRVVSGVESMAVAGPAGGALRD